MDLTLNLPRSSPYPGDAAPVSFEKQRQRCFEMRSGDKPIDRLNPAPIRYRMVIGEALGTGAEVWFPDADVRPVDDDQTIIEVLVADQAALHGYLHRIHDLHLKLVSVTMLEQSQISPNKDALP